MTCHREKITVPFSATQMFALVADIERYPEFLPWCLAAKIREKGSDCVKADLLVGTKTFKESFTSFVSFEKDRKITVSYGGGALSHLRNEWVFSPKSDQSCEISFFVEFKLKSRILGAMMDLFFEAAYRRMVAAFEQRARELYG